MSKIPESERSDAITAGLALLVSMICLATSIRMILLQQSQAIVVFVIIAGCAAAAYSWSISLRNLRKRR